MAAERKRGGASSAARRKAEPEVVPLVARRDGGEARPWMKRWLETFLIE